jgi:hypothetical protein
MARHRASEAVELCKKLETVETIGSKFQGQFLHQPRRGKVNCVENSVEKISYGHFRSSKSDRSGVKRTAGGREVYGASVVEIE